MQLKQFVRTLLFLLALSFLTESLGYLTHQIYQYLGITLLVLYGLSAHPVSKKTEMTGLFLSGWLLLLLSMLFLSGSILARLAGTGLFIFGLSRVVKSKGSDEKELPLLLATIALSYYLFLFYLYSPPLRHWMNEAALLFSTMVSRVSGIPVLFSSTFTGLPVTFLFLAIMLVSFVRFGRKKLFWFSLSFISLVVVNALYIILVGGLPRAGETLMGYFTDKTSFLRLLLGFLFEKDYPLTRCNYTMNAPLLLFVVYLVPLFPVLRMITPSESAPASRKGTMKNSLAFVMVILLSTALLVVDIPGDPSEKTKVVLYNQGYLNWQVPTFRMFGSKSAGMFGNLPLFLESMGFSVEKADAVSPETLKDAKILMMINVDRELPQDELQSIWGFVDGGGSLLLLGDHTFYKHGVKRIILNDILQPYSIRYNFDSADWFVGGWLHSYEYASHPVTSGMRDDMNDAGIVIGASLSAAPPAIPLIAGKYGYSDPGSELAGDQRGYLGNLNYDPGEPMGDIVLCAAEHHGQGKVLVFGDTSSFANAILVNSHGFVNRVFTWLAREESPKRYRLYLFGSLALLVGAFLFYRGTEGKSSLLVVSCILSLSVVGLAERLKHHENQRDVKGTIAYVDASHGERFSPESWNDNAVLGLHLNLMRNGYQSFTLWDFDERTLKQAQLLVVIAPSQPFSTQEIAWIKDFVQQGGMLFLSVGWEEKEASLPLMAALGFSIDYLPLAQFMSVIQPAGQKVRFFEAWPVMSTEGESQVIAAYQNLPVVIKKSYGKGAVVMIGDSSFFWNTNLEMEESHIPENVEFLKWLLSGMGKDA